MNTQDPRGTGGREGEDFTADWPARQRPSGPPPPPYGAAQGHQPFPPAPPQQFQQPPGWYPPGASPQSITVTPKPEKNRRRLGLAIGAAFLAGIVVAGGAFAAYEFTAGKDDDTASGPRSTNAWPPSKPSKPSGTPTPTTPSAAAPGNVDPAALRGFLLSAADLDGLLQTSGMVPTGVFAVLGTGGRVAPPTPLNCLSAWAVLNKATYLNSTTGVAGQVVGEEPKPYHQVMQAVAAFPDEAAARAFLDQEAKNWAKCQSQPINVDWGEGGGGVERAVAGPFTVTGDMLTLALERGVTEGPPLKCERAMTQRRNVIVDVRACRPTDPLVGAAVAQAIADKITG